jgi:adenine/guanine phosphoribosyltransferase-like PRPP-binding protein
MRPYRDEFDSIIVRGVSGLLVGAPVALSLKKELLVVRKPSEDCHDATRVVNWQNAGHIAVFVDDFHNTGRTQRICAEELEKIAPLCKIGACFFYHDTDRPECWTRPTDGWVGVFAMMEGLK